MLREHVTALGAPISGTEGRAALRDSLTEAAKLILVELCLIEAVIDGKQVNVAVHVKRLQMLDLLQDFRLVSYILKNVVHIFIFARVRNCGAIDSKIRPICLICVNFLGLLKWLIAG